MVTCSKYTAPFCSCRLLAATPHLCAQGKKLPLLSWPQFPCEFPMEFISWKQGSGAGWDPGEEG